MFERVTESARQAVVAAEKKAHGLGHSYVGCEHLLLGLLHDPECLAARVLASFDISFEQSRLALVRYVASGEVPPSHGRLPFTPRSKQVLERAGEESLSLGHNYAATEHILLALADVNEGVAMNILRDFDADARKIREAVMGLLFGPTPPPAARRGRPRMSRRHAARAAVTEPLSSWGIEVEPDGEVLRLLMSAAARALENGRTETTVDDLLIALARTEQLDSARGRIT